MSNALKCPDTEEYMNDEHYEYFKSKLIEEKVRLLEQSESQLKEMVGSNTNSADTLDKAQAQQDSELARFKRERTLKKVKSIDLALAAIREEEYGFCKTCGVEIGIPRLEANMAALECIDCQSLGEHKAKHGA